MRHSTDQVASTGAVARMLEILVHLSSFAQIPEYVCVKASIEDHLVIDAREFGGLPDDWNSAEPVRARALGTRWLSEKASAALRVPSAVISRESNYMLNPEHSDFAQIGVSALLPFQFDLRLSTVRLIF